MSLPENSLKFVQHTLVELVFEIISKFFSVCVLIVKQSQLNHLLLNILLLIHFWHIWLVKISQHKKRKGSYNNGEQELSGYKKLTQFLFEHKICTHEKASQSLSDFFNNVSFDIHFFQARQCVKHLWHILAISSNSSSGCAGDVMKIEEEVIQGRRCF